MACTGPSLSGAFDLLDAAGQDKLLSLQRKLKALRPGCRGADLLHAMVLLTLGQEAAARVSLEALRADAAARLVAHQWAGMDSSAEAPEEPPDVSWAVAQVYHLLAEERLCPAPMRDVAYQAALRAFGSSDDPRLGELQEEARNRCGGHIVGDPGEFRPLRSDLGCLPPSSPSPSGTRSLPRPIEGPSGWSRGRSLRSTGSLASLASSLDISQSPTMAVLSQPRSPCRPSKLGDEPPASPACGPVPMGCQEPEEMSWPPSERTANIPESPNSPVLPLPEVAPDASPAGPSEPCEAPDTGTHYPVECTEVSPAPQSLPVPSTDACPVKDQKPLQLPTEDTTLPTAQPYVSAPSATKTSPPDPSASTPGPARLASPNLRPPPLELESSEKKFYSFVVLHAKADEHIALRVRDKLEALGVPDGATFCEDFEVPGRGELSCLQDAIDHSAFTILLLTANFDCRLSLHKVGHSLMNSLMQHGRQDCVVPFLPLESSLAQLSPDTSSLLASLVWLDEHSRIFTRKVASTFKPQKLRAYKATWKKEQDVRALREQRQHLEVERQQAAALNAAYSAHLQAYLSWQAQMEKLQAAFGNHMTFGSQLPPGASVPYGSQGPLGAQLPFPTWPGHQPSPLPPWLADSPPPAFPQPPAFSQASPVTPQSPGLQPLIIHHAQMVQLGLNNHMWNQRGTQAPEDKTQDAE
ncbi:TIR domain-containing adapter molecule 1 [Pteropus medius]|uniref:TIR domain-containing adapter molecule 1 n=1 Tax=Pteropus vampyrus TaxID=132908 RepID=UPI00196A37DA|nr:TIR domain-containing adapter molecule 1 [Pteropus giganteus]XP_039734358.1 TIR domain-containing adapter molecule 1 [Pteropus giganteus]XP_039734359.1 TIR domain-containing adapter molecule 1 [Pteropus giganteus]XP_039734360.1 TIR domain-containing adapter molecule 1 [Pteropus giganteus]XP_039734361.1 TIR domain-containing adapter molecule 1 [Pteropus giganteus]